MKKFLYLTALMFFINSSFVYTTDPIKDMIRDIAEEQSCTMRLIGCCFLVLYSPVIIPALIADKIADKIKYYSDLRKQGDQPALDEAFEENMKKEN